MARATAQVVALTEQVAALTAQVERLTEELGRNSRSSIVANSTRATLCALVVWRKRSFGTQSERGDRFVERIMAVAHTARKQGVDALAFLTACCEAGAEGRPSLFDFAATA